MFLSFLKIHCSVPVNNHGLSKKHPQKENMQGTLVQKYTLSQRKERNKNARKRFPRKNFNSYDALSCRGRASGTGTPLEKHRKVGDLQESLFIITRAKYSEFSSLTIGNFA